VFNRFIAYRDKKLSVSLCVFVRRFTPYVSQSSVVPAGGLANASSVEREHCKRACAFERFENQPQ
jgi:hypothetical protein